MTIGKNALSIAINKIEDSFRSNLSNTFKDIKEAPEFFHGTMIAMDVNTFRFHMKEVYTNWESDPEKLKQLDISKNEWDDLVDKISKKVLLEFLDMNDPKTWIFLDKLFRNEK